MSKSKFTILNKQCWYCIFHHLAQYIVTIVIWLRLCEVFTPNEGMSDLLKMFVAASVGCWLIYSITPWGAKVSFSKRVWALSTQRQISILMFFHAEKTSRTFFSIVGPWGRMGECPYSITPMELIIFPSLRVGEQCNPIVAQMFWTETCR